MSFDEELSKFFAMNELKMDIVGEKANGRAMFTISHFSDRLQRPYPGTVSGDPISQLLRKLKTI